MAFGQLFVDQFKKWGLQFLILKSNEDTDKIQKFLEKSWMNIVDKIHFQCQKTSVEQFKKRSKGWRYRLYQDEVPLIECGVIVLIATCVLMCTGISIWQGVVGIFASLVLMFGGLFESTLLERATGVQSCALSTSDHTTQIIRTLNRLEEHPQVFGDLFDACVKYSQDPVLNGKWWVSLEEKITMYEAELNYQKKVEEVNGQLKNAQQKLLTRHHSMNGVSPSALSVDKGQHTL